MKTALDAHRRSIHTWGSPLTFRRKLPCRPLTRRARSLDASMFGRVTRALEGVAVVEYYGHPSRRMAIAFPLPGMDWRDVARNAKDASAHISGNVSCGNYVFKLTA